MRYSWNIAESGTKHHNTNPNPNHRTNYMYVYVVFVRSTEVDWYDHNPLLYVKSLVIFQSDCDLKLLLDLEWGDKTVEKWSIQYKKTYNE